MKRKTPPHTGKRRKRGRFDVSHLICWTLIPLALIVFLVLDGLGLYPLSSERLLVIGVCVVVVLIPFFSEITVKNVSLKKEDKEKQKP